MITTAGVLSGDDGALRVVERTLGAAYRWDRPSRGVLLTDGVGDIELASAFRPTPSCPTWPARSR